MTAREIRIGSRGSALAMAQATLVRDALAQAGHPSSIVVIQTEGDRRAPDTAWGEGAFVTAIEGALLDGRVDVAAHSAKDIPTDEDPRLRIAAYLPRADARDALVLPRGVTTPRLDELPAGSRVGTDSPRRTGFLRARRPDLRFQPLHGNVDSRLRRLDAGDADALVLACAGLDRLGLSDRITERLDMELVPPAPGQGAIAVQVRADDQRLIEACGSLDHRPTRIAVEAERAFLRASGGGCRAPIGAFASISDGTLELLGGHAQPDGSGVGFGRRRARVADGSDLGRQLAAELGIATRSSARSGPPAAPRPRVLVTRPAAHAGELLGALTDTGLDPVLVPAIGIASARAGGDLDRVARVLSRYAWVVITSANGARAILTAAERVFTPLETSRFAAIGSATRGVLEREGIAIEFQPSEPDSAAMAAELPIRSGDRVAVLRGDLADGDLPATLRERGAEVDDVIAYRTEEAPPASRPLLRAAFDGGPVDAIAFTSGSTVRGLCSLASAEAIEVTGIPAVCIGDETASIARSAGFDVIAVAASPDAVELAKATCAGLARRFQEVG